MHDLLLRAAWLMALAGAAAAHVANADIFTWVDASGRVNISNLDPPAGVRVTSVMHVDAPKVTAAADSAREAFHQAEVAALAERVRQLQDEVEAARRPPAPQPRYRAVAQPPAPYAGGDGGPDALPYAYAASPASAPVCDPSWADCAPFWGPVFPTSVIVLRAPAFHRFSFSHGRRAFASRSPVHRRGGGHMR